MPNFKYKAQNTEGKIFTGILVAEDEGVVSSRLEGMGYVTLSVLPAKKPLVDFKAIFKPKEKVKSKEIISFTRQFATVVKAGVPIVSGLDSISQQTESPVFKKILQNVVNDVKGGMKLSQALDKHPTVFSELYVNSIVAGEAGGVLDSVLLKLSEMMERDEATGSNVKSALRYPILTIFALGIAIAVLNIMVIPKFEQMFSKFGSDLPLPTKLLVATSNTTLSALKFWYIALPLIFGLWTLFKKYSNSKVGRWQIETVKLKLTVFGKLLIKVAMFRFVMMFNVLNQSGLPILKTLEVVSITIGNVVIAKEIEVMRKSVSDGKGIAGSLASSKIFPPLVVNMIAIGEKTGALEDMLNSVAEYYALEIKSMVDNLTTLIEPIMTAVLGIVVMFMALGIFLPLWGMIKLFRGAH